MSGTPNTNGAAHECVSNSDQSISGIVQAGSGILIYLRGQEGRGIGLANKIRAYALQDAGHDTVTANSALGLPVDARKYGPAVAMLLELGVRRVRLLTNNPKKVSAVEAAAIVVEERVPLVAGATVENKRYLQTKTEKLGHLLAQNIEH